MCIHTHVFILCCVGFMMYVSMSTYTLIFCVPLLHTYSWCTFPPLPACLRVVCSVTLLTPAPVAPHTCSCCSSHLVLLCSSHLLLLRTTESRAFTGRMPPRRSPTTAARSTPRLKVHVRPNSSHSPCTHLLIVPVHTYS